jgi:hypothetical protein
MKPLRMILFASLFLLLLGACQTAAPLPTQSVTDVQALLPKPGEKSMKGFELYSWQVDGEWVFAVLVGTNREKTLDEIQSPQARLNGVGELAKLLTALPAGEYVSWLTRDSLALPPKDIITQVEQICAEQGLELTR